MLRINEVAARLGVTRWTVYRLLERAQDPLPAYQYGGKGHVIRVNERELERWLYDEDEA